MTKIYNQLAFRLAALFADLIFPIECLGCREGGAYLCHQCTVQLVYASFQVCHFCKQPSALGATCSACRLSYSLDGVLVMAAYQDLLKVAIRQYKYHFVSTLAPELGLLLVDFFLGQAWEDDDALILPVPLSASRKRWRGFNQAALLAQSLSQATGLFYDERSLIRSLDSVAQAKLSQVERLQLSAQSFTWRGDYPLNRSILLVDDVVSTGQTLNAIATHLKDLGASQVWGLVLARGL